MKRFIETIKSILQFNKLKKTEKGLVFFSENSSYSKVFSPIIFDLINKGIKVTFISSDKNDTLFKIKNLNFKAFYISQVLGQILMLNYISCKNLVLTMPDLDTFHIKKSLKCQNYIYIFHSPVSTNMIYRNKAFFSYDKIFCLGQHHYQELSEYKNKFKLEKMTLYKAGYPKIDSLADEYLKEGKIVKKKITIAPSWGKKNILNYNIQKIIKKLLHNGYTINFRPHYQMLKFNKYQIESIKKEFFNNPNFFIENKNDSFEKVLESEFLITDWSGIGMEFSFITERPVIFINTEKKINNSNFNDIDAIPLEDSIREKIGVIVEPNESEKIEEILINFENHKNLFKSEIIKQRDKSLYNFRNSKDFIVNKLIELEKN